MDCPTPYNSLYDAVQINPDPPPRPRHLKVSLVCCLHGKACATGREEAQAAYERPVLIDDEKLPGGGTREDTEQYVNLIRNSEETEALKKIIQQEKAVKTLTERLRDISLSERKEEKKSRKKEKKDDSERETRRKKKKEKEREDEERKRKKREKEKQRRDREKEKEKENPRPIISADKESLARRERDREDRSSRSERKSKSTKRVKLVDEAPETKRVRKEEKRRDRNSKKSYKKTDDRLVWITADRPIKLQDVNRNQRSNHRLSDLDPDVSSPKKERREKRRDAEKERKRTKSRKSSRLDEDPELFESLNNLINPPANADKAAEGDANANEKGLAKSIYLGVCNYAEAEEKVEKRADFRLYHQLAHRPFLDELEQELALVIVYKTANGSYRHYPVKTKNIGNMPYYYVDYGDPKVHTHASLDNLVKYYHINVQRHPSNTAYADPFPWWEMRN